jgi:3'-phosphoadenosine 5'-phosphosulfate sulfotransferase (PAPS reductase)/FAD synthetase
LSLKPSRLPAAGSTPDLAAYDWILINSSGGKDSQAMLSHVVGLADAAGVDRSRIVVVYADLGRMVWPGTREIAEAQAGMLGVRFEVVRREKGDLLDYVREKNARRRAEGKTGTQTLSWPAAGPRWCTSDLKTGPVRTLITRRVDQTRQAHPGRRVKVLNTLGIRSEESADRAKQKPFDVDPANWSSTARNPDGTPKPHSKRAVDRWYPVFAWTWAQVWQEIRRSRLPWHWAYQYVDRLSCVLCVLAPLRHLVLGAYFNPDLAQDYQDAETETGHTFKPDLSVAAVITEAGQLGEVTARSPFDRMEIDQACGK